MTAALSEAALETMVTEKFTVEPARGGFQVVERFRDGSRHTLPFFWTTRGPAQRYRDHLAAALRGETLAVTR